jgi:acetyl-CoA synthetase
MNATDKFREARDFLLAHRTDYDCAYAEFQWPRLEHFNWALDWFDVIARGNSRTAPRIVDAAGLDQRLSFEDLRRRVDHPLLTIKRWDGAVRLQPQSKSFFATRVC